MGRVILIPLIANEPLTTLVLVMPDVSIRKIAPFALRREKREKTVDLRMEYAKGKYILPQNVILTDFLTQNIAMILNLDERIQGATTERPSDLFLSTRLRSRKTAVVVGFEKADNEKFMHSLLDAGDVPFIDGAKSIAELFRESLFWPRSYLFVVQFVVILPRKELPFLAVLATNVAYGELREHEKNVVDLIKEGIISKRIRKGIIYPKAIARDGGITYERKCKVYEQKTQPAQYWYRFLGLEAPYYAALLVRHKFNELKKKGQLRSFQKLLAAVSKEDAGAPRRARISIALDDVSVRSPLAEIGGKVKLSRFPKCWLITIRGETLSAPLDSEMELAKEGLLPLCPRDKLLAEISRLKPATA